MKSRIASSISFTSSGNSLFLMNHKTDEELLLNSDAATIIHMLDRGEMPPKEACSFIKELENRGVVDRELGRSNQTVSSEPVENLHLYEKMKSGAAKELIPFTVHLELTRRCPFSSLHCYLRDVPVEQEKELSTEEWIGVIDQLHELGAFHVTVTGGELFVRDDSVEILSAIRKRRMALSILSSGAGVSETVATQVADLGPMVWQTTLYGDETAHDGITGTVGSYRKMVKTARYMKQRGISVRVSAVMTVLGVQHLNLMRDLCVKEGFVLSFNTILMPGLGGTLPPKQLLLSNEQLSAIFDKIGFPDRKETGPDDAPCDAARSVLAINHRGDLYPCIEWRESAGNIHDDTIGEMWSNAPLFQCIRSLKNSSLLECLSCEYQPFCHRCPGHAIRQGHTMIEKDEWACKKAKIKDLNLQSLRYL